MKLMAPAMLSAAIKMQYRYSLVVPLLRDCLPVLTKSVEQKCILYFFIWELLTKIAKTPLGMPAALVLSIINCNGIWQIQLEIWSRTCHISEIWPDSGFARAGAEIRYKPILYHV